MKNVLEYKGYFTKVEYSVEDKVLHGKIEGIRDLVDFECENASNVEKEFHKAVDDYLQFCKELGQEPDKQYNGIFNVRITPALHRMAVKEAAKEGVTLNQFVASAVEHRLNG